MAKYSGPNFILELRMYTAPWQVDRTEVLFYCAEKMYNKLVHYINEQLDKMRKDQDYIDTLELYVNEKDEKIKKQYGNKLKDIRIAYGLTKGDLEKFINYQRNHSFKGTIDVDMAQKLANSAWNALSSCLFGKGKQVHYKKFGTLDSVECKKNTSGIKFDKNSLCVYWNGMIIPVKIRKNDYYAKEVLDQNEISYCRIVRKSFKNGYRYFVQIVLRGLPPVKPNRMVNNKKGEVGIDIGPSTIAVIGEDDGLLETLAPKTVKDCNKKIIQLSRKLERSRRINNLDNYNKDGTIKKGKLEWKRTNNYIKILFELKNVYRLRSIYLKEHQTKIQKKILSLGSSFTIEHLDFVSWQRKAKKTEKSNKTMTKINKNGNTKTITKYKKKKRFGKSLNNNAPGNFVRTLNQKLEYFNGKLEEVDTKSFKASQYRHDTDTYEKVPLSQRTKEIGGHEVQRDLYSAFLMSNKKDTATVDRNKCINSFDKFLKIQEKILKELESRNEKLPQCMGVKTK